jgi:mannose-1-phosphate guanylyltransferase
MRCGQIAKTHDNSHWGVILAGGEGTRLRSLTRMIAGDERPKQFCNVLGNETLLQQTARRVAGVVRPCRTKVVMTRGHEPFSESRTLELGTSVIIQPSNRGTAPAILYSLLSIHNEDPRALVALFPADHYCCDDAAFTKYVAFAFQAVERQPALVILLGVVPTGPEVDYGWIQLGEPIRGVLERTLFPVERFWEKPKLDAAKELLARGCLWNSFVLVGSVRTLLGLVRNTVPGLYSLFESVQPTIGTDGELPAISDLYARFSSVDFSGEVLCACPRALTVLPVADASWTDMGSVDRALGVVAS